MVVVGGLAEEGQVGEEQESLLARRDGFLDSFRCRESVDLKAMAEKREGGKETCVVRVLSWLFDTLLTVLPCTLWDV